MRLMVYGLLPEAFAELQKSPELVESLFNGDEATVARLGALVGGVDYRAIDRAYKEMVKVTGEGPPTLQLMESGTFTYDSGYGNASYLQPADLARVHEGLAWRLISTLDDDLRQLLRSALDREMYVVWVIA